MKNHYIIQFANCLNYYFWKNPINEMIQINQINFFNNKIYNNELYNSESTNKISYEFNQYQYKDNHFYFKNLSDEYYNLLIKIKKIIV